MSQNIYTTSRCHWLPCNTDSNKATNCTNTKTEYDEIFKRSR